MIDLIKDGFCNDETNNADCNYDGGDCCGPCTSMSQCTECACLGGAVNACQCKPNISVMGSMLGLFSCLDTPAQIIFQCMVVKRASPYSNKNHFLSIFAFYTSRMRLSFFQLQDLGQSRSKSAVTMIGNGKFEPFTVWNDIELKYRITVSQWTS